MIAFAIESAQMPPELRSIDLSTGNSRTLGPPREIDPETLATTERIEFQGSNGAPRKAAIYLPPGFRMGQRLRTIILLYPQDWSRADMLDTFGGGFSGFTRAQIYASRGFVVIIPDISLSPGDIADQIAGDVSSVINAAAGAGYTDPDRVGLLGYSFGGYSVLAAATRLPSLRAIVAGGAFGDLGAFYGKMQDSGFGSWAAWMENGHGRVGATPWGNPERYIRNSPFYRIDRIRAPLLLFVGMDDTSTPPWLSNQIFVAMRRAGNTVEYRQYAGEAHRFIGRASILDVANRAISWFDTHL